MKQNQSMTEDSSVGAMDHMRYFSKPELGRVTGVDGIARDALVYGFPKRFELDYLQGDEVEGFEGFEGFMAQWTGLTQAHAERGVTRLDMSIEDKAWMLENLTGQDIRESTTKGLNNVIGDDAAQRRAFSKAANTDGWRELA